MAPLQEPDSIEKIFVIDDHVGAAIAGLTADARVLIDNARIEAQSYRLLYDEVIPIELLTKRIGDIKQVYTQRAGVRPFGVSLLVAGVDDVPQLFMTDPSGAYWSYKAMAIGAGSNEARELLEKQYSPKLTVDESIMLSLNILKQIMKKELSNEYVEIAICHLDDKKFKILSDDEKEPFIKKVG